LAQGVHLPNAQRNPRIELVATCDINAQAAENCRVRFGAQRAETDWRKLVVAPDIDLFILATRQTLRGEFIAPALENGKPVYTEKPLSPDLDDMLRILRAVRKSGLPVCVGHNRRSSPAMIEFKRLLDKAVSGVPSIPPTVNRMGDRQRLPEEKQMQLLMRINDDARSWKSWAFCEKESILFAEIVHFIDLALWMNRSHPVRAFVEGSNRGNFTIILRFADGSMTTLQHSLVGHFDYPKELFEATVNNITVAMDQYFEIRQCGMADEAAVKQMPYAAGCEWATKTGMTGYMQCVAEERQRAKAKGDAPRWLNVNKGHYDHLDRFLDHIEGRGPNPCDVESAVPVNRLALKLLDSARLGLPVAVQPEDWHLPQLEA